MAKLDKVLAVYDRDGNRQAIPLYTTLEEVNNLGRKIKLDNAYAYYPLTENLTDPNASKKVIVIGTKTYKALLKVGGVGFRTILEALDSDGYISVENSHNLNDIDRSVGGEVKINANTDLNSYDYRAMYTNGTTIKLDNYTTDKYIDHLELSNLDTERNISYEIPAKSIIFGSDDVKYLNYTGNIKTVMSSKYDVINASQLFIGTSTYNTFDSCVFIGNHTSENITDMIENIAGSHISTKKFVAGHSSNICKIKLGDNTTGAEIDPFSNNANNRLDINTCKINENDKWQFVFMAGEATSDSNCMKYVTPVTKTIVNDKAELSYKYKTSKNAIKTKSEITGNSNNFKSLILTIDPSFSKDSLNVNISSIVYTLNFLALDANNAEIQLASCRIYEPIPKILSKSDYDKYVKTVPGTYPNDNFVFCDYDKVDTHNPFIKLVFGNDVLHTILIRPEYNSDTGDLYMNIKIIKSSKYNDSNSKTESRTWIYNINTRKVNPDISRYKNKRALIFNINNIENTRAPLSPQEKTIIGDKRRLLYFTSNFSSGSSIDSNKDLFLFNMFNIMNEKDYTGITDCGYIQQVIAAPENMKEQIFSEKVQKVLHGEYDDDAKYYPLNLKSF
jgi:hypothetical protein